MAIAARRAQFRLCLDTMRAKDDCGLVGSTPSAATRIGGGSSWRETRTGGVMSDVGQRGGEPPRPKQKVFISYAYRDRDLIGRIARDLEAAGFSPWHGEMLSPEQPFQATIERELDEADCVLVLWSRAAAQSQYVRTEIERAAE